MVWAVVRQVFSTLLELIQIGRLSDQEKDLEILVLRKQLAMMEHQLDKPVRLSRAERLTLAVIGTKLKAVSGRSFKQLRDVIRIVQPETVLRWHPELVRRKWAQQAKNTGGRPRTQLEIERLVVRFARENADWGYGKIQGELLKVAIDISEETIANILERHGIPPAPERGTSPRRRHLMTHYKEQLLACDFFTVETLFLQTIYVFFFIEVGTRRVHFAGCTTNPTGAWVAQQARQMMWELEDRDPGIRFLIPITIPSSQLPLIPFFTLRASTSSAHLIVPRTPMPLLSDGCARSVMSV
jgi:putative transposase